MYFPSLENMIPLIGIDKPLVKQLDFWLASRREAIKNYLDPLSFSQYANIDYELSLDLFQVCTYEEINVLRERFDVVIESSNTNVGSYYDLDDIPTSHFNYDLNIEEEISRKDIVIYYELILEPSTPPTIRSFPQEQKSMGKNFGVDVTTYTESKERLKYRMGEVLKQRRNG